MSKVSHFNFSLNTFFLWRTYLLRIPTSLCVIFIIITLAMLFGTSNNPMCHIFLILSFVYIFLSEPYLSIIALFLLSSVQSLSHWQCLLPHPIHHHKRHLSTAGNPITQQNNTAVPSREVRRLRKRSRPWLIRSACQPAILSSNAERNRSWLVSYSRYLRAYKLMATVSRTL